MNIAALILNLFIPGIGSFVVGKAGQGIGQIVIWGLGFLFTMTGLLAIFGLPMMIGAWIWGIVTAVGSGGNLTTQPSTINIVQQTGPSNSNVMSEGKDVTPSTAELADKAIERR